MCLILLLDVNLHYGRSIADQCDVNKMEASNLAIVFGPTLIRTPDEGTQAGYLAMANMALHNTLVEHLIEQCEVSRWCLLVANS
jgi:hypothetical protein